MPETRPGLVDTHCHLAVLAKEGLVEAALESCAEGGVTQIVSVGLNVEDSDANRVYAEANGGVWFTVGWHPHEPTAPDAAEVAALSALLAHPRAVAVGEIGLDLFFRPGYHETSLETQQRSIHTMYELAETHGKPVILHDRDSHAEILDVMRQHPRVRGVMHCFSGDLEFARACTALGYIISFSGIVTFPRSDDIAAAAAGVGDDEYTVETDAPFLAPVPYRGRRNLPGYVAKTAARVAELRGIAEDDARRAAAATARRLFTLPDDDTLNPAASSH